MFDGWESQGGPWVPCMSGWCGIGHMSCSLINARTPGIFQLGASQMRGAGGVVLAPWTEISCSYSGDGGTTDGQMCCGGCDPGRSFPPSDLLGMMQQHLAHNARGYNEVVVSSSYWVDHLPDIVEAFIVGRGGNDISWSAHAAFRAQYGLTDAEVPLIRL